MHTSPSQSALNTAAAALRGIWRGVLSRFGLSKAEPDGQLVIHNWISAIFCRLDELLAQYQAGNLLPVTMPRVASGEHEAVARRSYAKPVFSTLGMAESTEVSPQSTRTLRPLLRAVATGKPRATWTPRVWKPRPTPESYRIPLPLSTISWSRSARILKKCARMGSRVAP